MDYHEPVAVNADLSQRAVVDSRALAWQPSPTLGVERRILERDGGGEVARATSIVRYAADSRFPAHTHAAGEEYYVLEGVFSDEDGDHPAGTYVRNPPGSKHSPFTAPGCTIFVKLRQMRPAGEPHVRFDTADGTWLNTDAPGHRRMPLFEAETWRESVSLNRLDAGASVVIGDAGGSEILVLDGAVSDDAGTFGSGMWIRLPPGATQQFTTAAGCTFWLKTGHLTVE